MKIDWVKKLTSRKLWLAIASEVGMIMAYCGASENEVTQITAMIIGGATVIAYIIGEGLADSAKTYTVYGIKTEEEVKDEE